MEAQRAITREVDAAMQTEVGISKAEFSVLRTLGTAPGLTLRVGDLATALQWEKSRVAHLLNRMEGRALAERHEEGAPGRRTSVSLSPHGRMKLEDAMRVHEDTVSRVFFDPLTSEQAAAIREWSSQTLSATTSTVKPETK
jgi:DNA-binding MarR family transcriptional regulator